MGQKVIIYFLLSVFLLISFKPGIAYAFEKPSTQCCKTILSCSAENTPSKEQKTPTKHCSTHACSSCIIFYKDLIVIDLQQVSNNSLTHIFSYKNITYTHYLKSSWKPPQQV
ncbi:hypothetical protein GGR32_000610 [Mesonia hippocampi]|uniref:Uncharacterized protein n=1 Tax=Mesonia hippocampi TaxID=1628250 RepID=A0A840ESI6_9FLAO|nr:hypothetical protein [Mesonia hippocampi]MBB4118336.1 hypothetical protein [Mesonia hippocampi]